MVLDSYMVGSVLCLWIWWVF